MPLITINAADVHEYHGDGVPAEMRLYANRDFVASDSVFIERGSDSRPNFYQTFAASLVGSNIRIATGDAYSTTDALDDDGLATYTGVVYDANGVKLCTVFSNLRIPTELNPVNWSQLVLYSQGKRMKRPSTYLSSSAILGILSGYITAVVKASAAALGITKLDVDAVDLNNPTAVGTNSPLLSFAASDVVRGHVFLDTEPDDAAVPTAFGINQPQLAAVKATYRHLSAYAASGLVGLASDAADAYLANPDDPEIFIGIVDQTPPALNNGSMPPNLFLEYSKGFGLNINAGQIYNITPPYAGGPDHRIFYGDGQARIYRHAAFHQVKMIWYLPEGVSNGAVPVTFAQTEAPRYALYNNSCGEMLWPQGEYEVDHYVLLQRGGMRGSGNDPNGQGTIIRRIGALAVGETQASLVRFLPGGVSMFVTDMVLQSDVANTAALYAEGQGGTPNPVSLTIDGIFMDNLTVLGCAEAFKVHDTTPFRNWQVHNVVTTRRCYFYDQTVACYSNNSVNAGGYFEVAGFRPAPNGSAVGVKLVDFAKTVLDFNGIGAPLSAPGVAEGIRFTFLPGDVDFGADAINAAGANDLESGWKIYLTNTGGALPTGWSANTPYWFNATNNTLHLDPNNAIAGTNKVAISDAGTGTHKLWCARPDPVAAAVEPLAMVQISGYTSEGLTMQGLTRDEGVPWLLRVEDTAFANPGGSIDLFNCVSLAQCYIGASVRINLHGGQYRAESFKDRAGVSAVIHNYGANIFTVGVGGPQNTYAGYTVPAPARLDDFIGNSYFAVDNRVEQGSIVGTNANDVPMGGLRLHNPGTPFPYTFLWERSGSGEFAGWWYRRNSLQGVAGKESQVGMRIDGGFVYSGRLLNGRSTPVAVGAGTLTMNLRDGMIHTTTPAQNATVEFINPQTAQNGLYYLRILTSGTTSFTLTGGALVTMQGAFRTGTVAGVYHVLVFYHDGTRLIEMGRKVERAGTVVIDPTSIAANTVSVQTFSVPGAVIGDALTLNPSSGGIDGAIVLSHYYVSAADQITIVFYNTSGAPVDMGATSWSYTLVHG